MSREETSSDLLQGLLYTHQRANLNTVEAHRALAAVEALLEVLVEQGVIDREAYAEQREAVEERLRREFVEKGMAVAIQEHPTGKYEHEGSVEIDCEARIPLCGAACCRLSFALSKEDVEEGTVRWDLGRPYMIARTDEGRCVHLDGETRTCGVYAQRPIPCRAYDCRKDLRVWLDFDERIPNPALARADWPSTAEAEAQAALGRTSPPDETDEASSG